MRKDIPIDMFGGLTEAEWEQLWKPKYARSVMRK